MATAVLNGTSSYTVTAIANGIPVKNSYPLASAVCDYLDLGVEKRLILRHEGRATIELSSLIGAYGYGNTVFGSTNPTTAAAAAEAAIGTAAGGGGGGGGGTPVTAAIIEQGVVAANNSSNAVSLATKTRVLTTNATGVTAGAASGKTIAAGARGYQIVAEIGSFTLDDGPTVTYTAGSQRAIVNRPVMQGFTYDAIVITPGNSSQILIEEFR